MLVDLETIFLLHIFHIVRSLFLENHKMRKLIMNHFLFSALSPHLILKQERFLLWMPAV